MLFVAGVCRPAESLPWASMPDGNALHASSRPHSDVSRERGELHHLLSPAGAQLRWGSSMAAAVKPHTQTLAGAMVIFGVERGVWAYGKYLGRRIPSAPAGMMLVFGLLLAANSVAPVATSQVPGHDAGNDTVLYQDINTG